MSKIDNPYIISVDALKVIFENLGTDLTSDRVQGALTELFGFLRDDLYGFHSGLEVVPLSQSRTILDQKQSVNFTMLTLDGTLNLKGDLWLA